MPVKYEDRKTCLCATTRWIERQWADKDCYRIETCRQVILAQDTIQRVSFEGRCEQRPYTYHWFGGQKAEGVQRPRLSVGLGW